MRILIIRFSSLGDVVLTTGVIKFIKSSVQNLTVDVLTFTQFAAVFDNNTDIADIYCIDKGAKLGSLLECINKMPDYDYIFDLHDNLRSKFVKMTIPAKSYTYNKESFARRMFVRYRLFKNRLDKSVVERYLEPFCKVFKLEYNNIEQLRPYLPAATGVNKCDIKRVTIHPFASKRTKEWPFVYELCKVLTDLGISVRVVGNGNIKLPDEVDDQTGYVPISRLIRNIADSDLFISTDSGPLHIATALNLPVVAIFGPTTKEFGFYPMFKNCVVIEDNNLKCRPCHIHGSNKCPKRHFQCMLSATIEEVRSRVISLLA